MVSDTMFLEANVPVETTIDHIAFLVSSLDDALEALADLGLDAQPVQTFDSEGSRECYLGGETNCARLLLIEAVGPGPYADAMDRRGPGLHHVALAVDDLDAFLAEVVDGSGWLVHPRSFHTKATANTVWLARPGVEALVECFEAAPKPGEGVVEQVQLAGLDIGVGLAGLFEAVGISVVAGPRSGAVIGDRFWGAPGDAEADKSTVARTP